MNSDINRNHNTVRTPNSRRRSVGEWIAGGTAIAGALIFAGHYYESNHIESADTKAKIVAEVGHIPAGIEAIKKTKTPGVEEVRYVVQSQPEKMFVSSVAADLHPIAPNQDPIAESDAINTYVPTTERDNLYPGEEINMLIDTNNGEILPNPRSVKSNG